MRDVLGDLAERTTLFTEVHHETDATTLCHPNALFDGVYQVWLAGADVRAENIRTVTCSDRWVSEGGLHARQEMAYIRRVLEELAPLTHPIGMQGYRLIR